jgi:uncharacterized protein (TIGR03083 family)
MVLTQGTMTTTPRQPMLDRPVAMRLAATEYHRFAELLRAVQDGYWELPTDCPAWDVRALATHVLGMAEMAASVRESIRQNWWASRRGGLFIDALTALQVEEHRNLSPQEVVERFAAMGPRAAHGRTRTPSLIRRSRMPIDQLAGGTFERWTFGYLLDIILTRDTWMHRVDISRATGQPLVLTTEHDGVLIADVVAEWASRHRQPCTLTLWGTAGGEWSFGGGAGPHLQLDAVEFCRILSGRSHGEGLLAVEVPF